MNFIRLRISITALIFGRITNGRLRALRRKPELEPFVSESLDLTAFDPNSLLVGLLREDDFLLPEGFDFSTAGRQPFFALQVRFEADLS